MHRTRGLLIPLTLLFLVFTTCAVSSNRPDTDTKESLLARALLNREWQEAVKYAEELLKEKDSPVLYAVLAYALSRTGKKKKALERLSGRTDHISLLTRAAIKGTKGVKLGSLKKPARSVGVVFVESRRRNGVELGVVSRAVEVKTLKQVFYELKKEPTTEEITRFREKVLSAVGEYVLAGEPIHFDENGAVYMMFVDTGSLKKAVDTGTRRKVLRIGVITHRGDDRYRKNIIKELRAHGYSVKDLGKGELYKIQDKLKTVDMVIELVEDVVAGEKVLGGNFRQFEARVEMTVYSAHPVKSLLNLKDRTAIVHVDDAVGEEMAIKSSYEKLLSRLYTTMHSIKKQLAELDAELPLKVRVNFDKVFSSNYKYYASYPAGTITLKNTTTRPFKGVTVSIAIKKYIDYPTRLVIGELPSGKTIRKPLNIVFNSRILDITDNTFIQSEVKVTYIDSGRKQEVTLSSPIYVYEKHVLIWDDKGKIASFITPRDPVIVDIATAAVSGYNERGLSRNVVKARALFEAMGVLGISYMEDPNSPFSVVSGLKGVVDFVQFPRETIARKVGDCDDLTSLYSSLLEAVGIRTAVVDVPGHVFVLMDTGVPESEEIYFGFPRESYVLRNGTIWIPVETTLVGASFTEAWKKGSENYKKWLDKAKIIEFEKARARYLAPNLPKKRAELTVSKKDIERRFTGELERLRKKRIQYVRKRLSELGSLGLIKLIRFYAREGMLDDAIKVARSIHGFKRNAMVLNNLGNVYYLKRKYHRALKYYRDAYRLDKKDAGILINIARAYMRLGNRKMAKLYFDKALKIDSKFKDRYITLYTEING